MLNSSNFRDLADGLQQQMFFWGQDVIAPQGNFLKQSGFERSASLGLKGTSRYRMPWRDGVIELYGSCAGWYRENDGFAFIRPYRRCYVWLGGEETPIPGAWQTEQLDLQADRGELYQASIPFLDWLLHHEASVRAHLGQAHREESFNNYQKVPKARAWLPPDAALKWFTQFRHFPEKLERAREFKRSDRKLNTANRYNTIAVNHFQ